LPFCGDIWTRMANEWRGNLVVATPRSVAELADTRIIARRVERIGQRPCADATAPGGIARLFIRFRARGSAPLRSSAAVEPLRQRLCDTGFIARVIADGAAAVTALAQRPPHLVIIDWNAPGFAALEVMALAHRMREPHRVRLILRGAEYRVLAFLASVTGSPLRASPAPAETWFSFLLFHTMFHA
jgi:hypothetical protein